MDGAFAGSAFAPENDLPVNVISFSDIAAGLQGGDYGAAAWGDFDADGDVAQLLAGYTYAGNKTSLYRNDGGEFHPVAAGLPGVSRGGVAWGDYDNDGDLDILLTGLTNNGLIASIFRNDGHDAFAAVPLSPLGINNGSATWVDYDDDGDLDFAVTGDSSPLQLFRNDGDDTFVSMYIGAPYLRNSSQAWADYDGDGDLDLLLMGFYTTGPVTLIYRNDGGGTFYDIAAGLPGLEAGAAAWGDYDGDGDPDILLTGRRDANTMRSLLCRNDGGGAFTEIDAGLPGVAEGDASWGDYDGDGDSDILLSGVGTDGLLAGVYRNDGDGVFAGIPAGLVGTSHGVSQWVDYDGDGDLDILLTGFSGASVIARIYRSDGARRNLPPAAPRDLFSSSAGDTLILGWSAPVDDRTPSAGLSYEVRVGKNHGGFDIHAPAADPLTGFRRLVSTGSARQHTAWKLILPDYGPFYWSVQAVDAGGAGSVFAPNRSPERTTSSLPLRPWACPTCRRAAPRGATTTATATSTCCWRGKHAPAPQRRRGVHGIRDGVSGSGRRRRGLGRLRRRRGSGPAARRPRRRGALRTDLPQRRRRRVHGRRGGAVRGWTSPPPPGPTPTTTATSTCCSPARPGRGASRGSTATTAAEPSSTPASNCPAWRRASAAWDDYDGDGDLDLLLAGWTGAESVTRLYRNDGGGILDDAGAALPGVRDGTWPGATPTSTAIPDILLTGESASGPISRVYRNEGGGIFSDAGADLIGMARSSAAWCDADADGDQDILLAGRSQTGAVARIYYLDDTAAYRMVDPGFTGVADGSAVWGDANGDGRPDVLLSGTTDAGDAVARLYLNRDDQYDTPPSTPEVRRGEAAGSTLILAWDTATDGETPVDGLTYNLRVGTTPGGSEICPPQALAADGRRLVAEPGNVRQATERRLRLADGVASVYWSVQTIDGALAGSPFSAEQHVVVVPITFTETAHGLPALSGAFVAWGDADGDGDLDALTTGTAADGSPSTRLYRNNGHGEFARVDIGVPDVADGCAAWGDFDRDGDLDLLLAGSGTAGIYRNGGDGTFTDIAAGLPGTYWGSADWGDGDNDGDLDVLLTGFTSNGIVSRIYRNEGGGAFVDVEAGLPGVMQGGAAWDDCDGDGDLDVLLAGWTGSETITRVYLNDGSGGFIDAAAGLPGIRYGSAAWGDFDRDGDADLAIAGLGDAGPLARIYRNEGPGGFRDIDAGFPGLGDASCAWGDYDDDGDLDLLFTGDTDTGRSSRIYRNEGGHTFTVVDTDLAGIDRGDATWCDVDEDGDLDVLLTGVTDGGAASRLYRNDCSLPNSPPSAPDGLSVEDAPNALTFRWNPATDDRTPAGGMTYNLRVGTTPGGSEICAAMAAPSNGDRLVELPGNARRRTAWTLRKPSDVGRVYWTVQAIDGIGAGSRFAAERSYDSTRLFTSVMTELPQVRDCAAAWGDCDGDGDLDLLLAGRESDRLVADVHLNDGAGRFTAADAGFTGVGDAAAAWGDYDNDGDLDTCLRDERRRPGRPAVRNDGGAFSAVAASFVGVSQGSVAWGDYDNDGDLDILLTGIAGTYTPVTKVYRNDGGGAFTDVPVPDSPGIGYGSVGLGGLRQRRRPRHPAHRFRQRRSHLPRLPQRRTAASPISAPG